MSSDSVVAANSQISWWAQKEAIESFGFGVDPMTILEVETAIAELPGILGALGQGS